MVVVGEDHVLVDPEVFDKDKFAIFTKSSEKCAAFCLTIEELAAKCDVDGRVQSLSKKLK